MATKRLQNITREINRNQNTPLSIKRSLRTAFGLLDDTVAVSESFTNSNLRTNGLISGGAVWLTGLTFAVSICEYVVNGVLYTSPATQVTLGAADGSNPRFDAIAVDTAGAAVVVAGTAAAAPVRPEVDGDTQVEVTFVLIDTSATTPSGVTTTTIYAEDAEWTAAVSANGAAADTSDPHGGTKAVLFTDAVTGDYATFTNSAVVQPAEIDTLFFYVKNTASNGGGKTYFDLAWYNDVTRVSDWVRVWDGTYNWNFSDTSDYQLIQIPFSDFNADGTSIDVLRINFFQKGPWRWNILFDDIKYQKGVPTESTTNFAVLNAHNVYSKAQGSAITTLTDAATVVWDMAPSNVYYVTLGGNRIIGAPTNVKPGYTYILFIDQGAGSRTLTWNAAFLWAGGTAPTLATGAAAVDVVSFVAGPDGSLYGSLGVADAS